MNLHTTECLNFLSAALELHEASRVLATSLIYISFTLLTGISAVISTLGIRGNKSLFCVECTTDEKKDSVDASEEKSKYFVLGFSL